MFWNKKITPEEMVTEKILLDEVKHLGSYTSWWNNNTDVRRRRMTWEAFITLQIGITDEMVKKS